AHDLKTPSYSSRKSKCRWLAACFWMTKRSRSDGTTLASPPEGSAVRPKSRICWYRASLVVVIVAPIGSSRFNELAVNPFPFPRVRMRGGRHARTHRTPAAVQSSCEACGNPPCPDRRRGVVRGRGRGLLRGLRRRFRWRLA